MLHISWGDRARETARSSLWVTRLDEIPRNPHTEQRWVEVAADSDTVRHAYYDEAYMRVPCAPSTVCRPCRVCVSHTKYFQLEI